MQQNLENAIRETLGAPYSPEAAVAIMVRIDHDICTVSVDTSGAPLHKRGYKEAVNSAPIRETMASLFLRQCGFVGTEPVVDPMCGSGTFVIEAAEIAARLNPGRSRHFAFEKLASFDPAVWEQMRAAKSARMPSSRCYGSDRDAGAVEMSHANAERAGVTAFTDFRQGTISELFPPAGPPGLVITNPPFGKRLSDGKDLFPLYGALGQVLKSRFAGWRAGVIASEPRLAHATGLPFVPMVVRVSHGGLQVFLFQTNRLP